MFATSKAVRRFTYTTTIVAMSALISTLTTGCGADASKPKLGKVSGTVTYKGQPVQEGSIMFTPSGAQGGATGQGATSQIENGKYTLTTFDTGDGAILGQHTVTVLVRAKATGDMGKQKTDGTIDYRLPKSVIPEKYTSVEKSPLKFTIDATGKTIDIDLKD